MKLISREFTRGRERLVSLSGNTARFYTHTMIHIKVEIYPQFLPEAVANGAPVHSTGRDRQIGAGLYISWPCAVAGLSPLNIPYHLLPPPTIPTTPYPVTSCRL